jgi:CheY-like chemotaxis protein
VLVADGDPALREVLGELLAGQGHRVREAGDGEAALAILAELGDQGQAPDLLLLDLALPRLDGAGLLRRLAADRAAFPILALGGQGRMLPPEAAVQVREVLEKPLDVARLLARVSLALGLGSAAPAARPSE